VKDRNASDGILARSGHFYAGRKLAWLDTFLAYALTVTQDNPDRIFVDLFAGPGRSVVAHPPMEMSGGAIRTLRTCANGKSGAALTATHCVNLNRRHHDALVERIRRLPDDECLVPRDKIHLHHADANEIVRPLMKGLPPQSYTLVFADPESAQQLPWETIKAIRQAGPERVDLYMLFPYGMDITRNMPWGKLTQEQQAVHDGFFGTERWRDVVAQFTTNSRRRERRRAVMDFYLGRLRSLWKHAIIVEDVALRGDQNLYYMLFASRHDVAERIAAGVTTAKKKAIGQGDLFG